MKSFIKAIEYYLPEKVVTNQDLKDKFPDLRIDDLTRLTGVYERHAVAEDQTAADMGILAAEKLFAESGLDRGQIDFVILCTTLGDYVTPASACLIQEKLKLPKECGAFDFNQGCTGYLYGLSLAKGLIESGQAQNVLLLTSEIITKKIHPLDKSNMAIFGDGAAATWIAARDSEKGIGNFVFGTDGSGFETIMIKHGASRHPFSDKLPEDYPDAFGNIRNDACFYMNGSEVFSFSLKRAPEMIKQVMQKNGTDKEDIKMFVLHQANHIILESVYKKLKVRKDQEFFCLEKWGNTVQSTIPIALKEGIKQGKIIRGDKLLLAGFGVGLSWAGTLLEF
jgi:3-oxoacyl-[acyl-carrier-protein] synthase III